MLMINLQEQSDSPISFSCNRNIRSIYDGPPDGSCQPPLNLRAKVAKLLDAYLAEVARDSKLPLSKFQSLAEALPEGSRLCDDGLYRAVDTFLKVTTLAKEYHVTRCLLALT